MTTSSEFSDILADLLREEFVIDRDLFKDKAKLVERKRKTMLKAEGVVGKAVAGVDENLSEEEKNARAKTRKVIKRLEVDSKKRVSFLKKVLELKESGMIKSILDDIIGGVGGV